VISSRRSRGWLSVSSCFVLFYFIWSHRTCASALRMEVIWNVVMTVRVQNVESATLSTKRAHLIIQPTSRCSRILSRIIIGQWAATVDVTVCHSAAVCACVTRRWPEILYWTTITTTTQHNQSPSQSSSSLSRCTVRWHWPRMSKDKCTNNQFLRPLIKYPQNPLSYKADEQTDRQINAHTLSRKLNLRLLPMVFAQKNFGK